MPSGKNIQLFTLEGWSGFDILHGAHNLSYPRAHNLSSVKSKEESPTDKSFSANIQSNKGEWSGPSIDIR
jgi:hypothetical protein